MGAVSAILSYPFRLAPNGAVAVVDQDSEQADREQIAVLALTVLGERPLVPAFGVNDPTHQGFELTELVAGIGTFGPPVNIADVTVTAQADDTQLVAIEFD